MQGTLPLYRTNPPAFDFQKSNAGLWYDKFCNRWCMDPEKNGLESWSMESFDCRDADNKRVSLNPKMQWISTVVGEEDNKRSIGDRFLLKEYWIRREAFFAKLCQKPVYLKSVGPFVTGLGRNHPVENGFAWHHTLGVPYLPGSSIKGMVRSWAVSWILEDKAEINRIFGPRDSKDHSSGSVIFLDAIPIKPVNLKADIMTPHYGPYYHGDEPPADWFSPIPIPFLVMDSGQEFIFGVMPRRLGIDKNDDDCSKAKSWLVDALKNIGAGAKTAVGYGRFEPFMPVYPKSDAAEWLDNERDKLAESRNLSPSEVLNRAPYEIAKNWQKIEDPELKDHILQEIKASYGDRYDHPKGRLRDAKRDIYEPMPKE